MVTNECRKHKKEGNLTENTLNTRKRFRINNKETKQRRSFSFQLLMSRVCRVLFRDLRRLGTDERNSQQRRSARTERAGAIESISRLKISSFFIRNSPLEILPRSWLKSPQPYDSRSQPRRTTSAPTRLRHQTQTRPSQTSLRVSNQLRLQSTLRATLSPEGMASHTAKPLYIRF